MTMYLVKNRNESPVLECQLDAFLSQTGECNYKGFFKSDGDTENRVYMIGNDDEEKSRIDAKYSQYGTFIITSDFGNRNIEDRMIKESLFKFFKVRV